MDHLISLKVQGTKAFEECEKTKDRWRRYKMPSHMRAGFLFPYFITETVIYVLSMPSTVNPKVHYRGFTLDEGKEVSSL